METITISPIPEKTFPMPSDFMNVITLYFSINKYWRSQPAVLPVPKVPSIPLPVQDPLFDKASEVKQTIKAYMDVPKMMVPTIINEISAPIKEELGIDILSLIPNPIIPGIPIGMEDLLPPYDVSGLLKKIATLMAIPLDFFDPLVIPDPFNPPLLSPTFEEIVNSIPAPLNGIIPPYGKEFGSPTEYVVESLQYVINYCANILVNIVNDVVGAIQEKIDDLTGTLPPLPFDIPLPLPTVPEIIESLAKPTLEDLKSRMPISELMSKYYPDLSIFKKQYPDLTLSEIYDKLSEKLEANITSGYEKILETAMPSIEDLKVKVKELFPIFPEIEIPDPLLPDLEQPVEDFKMAIQMYISQASLFTLEFITKNLESFPIIGGLITGVLPKASDIFPIPSITITIPDHVTEPIPIGPRQWIKPLDSEGNPVDPIPATWG